MKKEKDVGEKIIEEALVRINTTKIAPSIEFLKNRPDFTNFHHLGVLDGEVYKINPELEKNKSYLSGWLLGCIMPEIKARNARKAECKNEPIEEENIYPIGGSFVIGGMK